MPLTEAPHWELAWQGQLSAQLLPDKPAGIRGRNRVRGRAEGTSRASGPVPTAGDPAHARNPGFWNEVPVCLWLRQKTNEE